MGWAAHAIAPWTLGAALAVSIPADAGQDQQSGASLAPLSMRAPAAPGDLIPAQIAGLAGALGPGLSSRAPYAESSWAAAPDFLRAASLAASIPSGAGRLADEIAPRADRKHAATAASRIDRTHRGDPAVGLRPTFDAGLRREGDLASLRAHDLLFEHDAAWPVSALDPSDADFAGPESVAVFEPWADGETPTTGAAAAGASPAQARGALTMRPAAVNARLAQGATPAVSRAAALGSTTPAPSDARPIEVALARPGQPFPSARDAPEPTGERPFRPRPSYASLPDQERRCLAEAVYFEARGESETGQAAVAQVVLNRVSSGLYPPTVCGVVYQSRRRRDACQFSFACDGRTLRISEARAWRDAVRIAAEVSAGTTYLADVGGATHYHASYVRPRWARSLEKMDVIGRHIFYKLRPGQT